MIVTLVPNLPSGKMEQVEAAASYKTWKQMDSQWGSKIINTKPMSTGGCRITVMAMLMVKAGIKNESNFNPGIALDLFKSTGYVDANGNTRESAIGSCGLGLTFCGQRSLANVSRTETISYIKSLYDQGYYCEFLVRGSNGSPYGHAVALDYVEGNDIYILDPGYYPTGSINLYTQSRYVSSGINHVFYFKKNGTVPVTSTTVANNNTDQSGLTMPTVTISVSRNSRAVGVQWIQTVLNRTIGTSLSVDGVYGNGTKNAVITFQKKYGLSADGVVGPATRAKMQEVWNASKVINVTSVSMNPTSMTLTTGKSSAQISVNVSPSNATDKAITWSSSNNQVAKVSNGVVTAVSPGTASITASSKNGKTASCTVKVYNPCEITFVNEDGTVLSKQTVDYGKSAVAPQSPEKTGYTFAGWSGVYQNVTKSATVTATYTKNVYKVTFKETDGTKIGSTQNVPYDEAATEPDKSSLHIPDGYTFVGWSEKFDHVTSDLDIYPVYEWADEELPITVSAEEDGCKADYNEGTYSLTFKLINHSDEAKRARVMTYMITDSGKMVAQGETRTVKVPAAKTNEDGEVTEDGTIDVDDMYIVCTNPAAKARIVVLDDYESAVPLAEIKDVSVEAAGYGEWTDDTSNPTNAEYKTRTVYRSKGVNYKTSNTTNSIAGWTLYNTKSTNSGNGDSVYYGNGRSASAPAKSGAYRVWATAISYAYNPSSYTVPTYNISISTTGGSTYQSMVKWIQCCLCRYGYSTSIDGVYGYNTAAAVKNFQSANGLTVDGIVGTGTRTCMQNKLNSDPLYNYYYESVKTTYTYSFYQVDSNWSEWKTEAIAGDTTLKAGTTKTLVESKTEYRYKVSDVEESGTAMTPECKLPEDSMDLAGKDAVVIVFKNKVNQIAEDNVEYIGDTKIGTDGTLNLSFVPREEQSYEGTGDYTVVLGVKGTSNYVKVGTIEAPKPKYTVTFVDEDGTELDSQEIEEGQDAAVPEEIPEKEGYVFTGWDTGVTNIHADMTVTAQYEKESYTVTYVDWENRTFDTESYEYGDIIQLPEEPNAPEGMEFTGWGVEENTEVTKDIVCEAQYQTQKFTVTFVDWNGEKVVEESIPYGESAISPEVVEEGVEKEETVPEKVDNMSFVSWGEDVDLSSITTNLVVGAIYEYDETVSMPTASVESGEYEESQTITLSSETEDAIIYYTVDGSDPTDVENTKAVKTYTSPITIDDKTQLKFYACKMGMNDSAVNEEWYCINKTGNKPTHLVNIYAVNVFDMTVVADYRDFVEDGKLLDATKLLPNEYDSVELQGIYYDAEFTEQWQEGAQTITESLTLYAQYDAKKFTVTYLDEDGTELGKGEVQYGMPVGDTELPEKDGYRFVGWDSEDNVDEVTKDITVTAKYIPADEYAVIRFGRSKYSVMEGTTFKLTPKVTYDTTGDTASDESIIWSSSDENIAAVDDVGNVTALAKGEVTISAKIVASGEKAECTITITGNPETSICLLSNSSYKLQDGYLRNIEIGKNSVAEIKKQINADNLRFKDDSNVELSDDDYAGTATRVQLLDDNGALLDEVEVILVGDYNGDGLINGKDVSGITRCLLGKETATDVQLRAMDLNGDGNVNNRDASMLARYLVGKEEL
jgi:peptidoglycan hydrolase-like protein with peptidoglycan-binding domain